MSVRSRGPRVSTKRFSSAVKSSLGNGKPDKPPDRQCVTIDDQLGGRLGRDPTFVRRPAIAAASYPIRNPHIGGELSVSAAERGGVARLDPEGVSDRRERVPSRRRAQKPSRSFRPSLATGHAPTTCRPPARGRSRSSTVSEARTTI